MKFIIYEIKTRKPYVVCGRKVIFDYLDTAARFCKMYPEFTIVSRNFDLNHSDFTGV